MLKNKTSENIPEIIDIRDPANDFTHLLNYINDLARHKLGYPVSLLTFLGIIDNQILGIKPNSLANVLLNNVGDPFKDSETSRMEVKRHERMLIAILEKYYGLQPNEARGYVTTGGTEGNFAGLWWSKRYLITMALEQLIAMDDTIRLQTKEEQELTAGLAKISQTDYPARALQLQKLIDIKNKIIANKNTVQELITPTVFYSKEHTHYSVPKIAEVQRLNIRPIKSTPDGCIDLEDFKKELMLHLSSRPKSGIIVIANVGTTITGAIDDAPGIKNIIESCQPKPLYTIHLDGALTGFVMPILKPFGNVLNYFDAIGVNTIAFSAHKYPGLSQPCGIILAKRDFFEKAFEKSERSIDYVGNILDVTITGSRSGLNVLMFYNALCALGLNKNNNLLTTMVQENLKLADYLREQLIKLYGKDKVQHHYHFNVMFPKPSMEIAKKYQLMITGETATICVLTNVTKELIDQFIVDLQIDKEKVMTINHVKEEDTTIVSLKKEHLDSALDLFIKSFCDSEPTTKQLGIQYKEYEPFAKAVLTKAIKDDLAVVALDKKGKVIACAIAEDIVDPFEPNLSLYPKMKPIFSLLNKLSLPFLEGKNFIKNKIAHIWIAIVDKHARGKGLSTKIDMACATMCVHKGFDFAYAEFTNDVSEKITHHYNVYKLCNRIDYKDFTDQGEKPFKTLKGGATAYIIGIRPDVSIDSLQRCYTLETNVSH